MVHLASTLPRCYETILYLERRDAQIGSNQPHTSFWPVGLHFLAYPRSGSRPIPAEVPSPYRDDFSEACKVLADSPKASAALSRRCLQAIFRDKAGTKKKDLADQIDEVISSGKLQSHMEGELDAVRHIGNFAAHPTKSKISDELLATDGRGVDARLKEIEAFVLSGLRSIRGRLTGEIPRAKAELAKHCTEITLTPEGESYRLSGEWDLLGDVRSDGAEGPECTVVPQVNFLVEVAA